MRDARDGRLLWEDRSRLTAEPSMSRKILFRGAGEQLFLPEVSGAASDRRQRRLGPDDRQDCPVCVRRRLLRDAKIVALARSNASVAVWDVDAAQQVGSLDEHGASVFCIAFAPQDRFLVSGSRDKKLRIFDLRDPKPCLELIGHKGGITAVAISPDGESLVSSDETGELIIWETPSGRVLNRWQNEGPVTSLSLSADGELLACATAAAECWSGTTSNSLGSKLMSTATPAAEAPAQRPRLVVLNVGSLNVDRVFRLPHVVRPGETLASGSLSVFAGGKGANQSVALARAGARVAHLGRVGPDGSWLVEKLAAEGVDTPIRLPKATHPRGRLSSRLATTARTPSCCSLAPITDHAGRRRRRIGSLSGRFAGARAERDQRRAVSDRAPPPPAERWCSTRLR